MSITALRPKLHSKEEQVEHPDFVRTLPRVNLLPAAVREDIAVKKVRRRYIAAGILVALGMAGLWYLQGDALSTAELSLQTATSENQHVAAEVKAMTPIKLLTDQIAAQENLVRTTLSSNPQAAAVLSHLQEAGAQGGRQFITLSDVSVTYSGIPSAVSAGDPTVVLNPCPTPNPFDTQVAVGCVTFTGTAASRQDVANFLIAAGKDPFFVGAYVDSTTLSTDQVNGPATVTFSGTTGISTNALVVPLTQEQIDAIVASAKPKPANGSAG